MSCLQGKLGRILLMCNKNCNKGDIYIILNIKSHKAYIGQVAHWTKRGDSMVAKGAVVRILQHFRYALGNGAKSKDHPKLYNAIRKHGRSEFICTRLMTCDMSELDKYEMMFIELYNITYGGQDRRPYDVDALADKIRTMWKDKAYRDMQVSKRHRKFDLPYGISPKRNNKGDIDGYQVVIIRDGTRYGRVIGPKAASTMDERYELAVKLRDDILAQLGEVA